MSEIKVNSVKGISASTAAITVNSSDGTCSANITNDLSNRNVIINGDPKISQRATTAGSITAGGWHTVDRWYVFMTSAGTWAMYQDADIPSGYGFSKSVSMDVTTANTSLSAGSQTMLTYFAEGQDVQRFCKGTSNAKKFALSFWVKCGKTGTYVVELFDHDNSRHICKTYSISSANTWEQKKLVFDNETSNAFGNDNGKSLEVNFWLVAGSTYTSGTLATSWAASSNGNRAVGQVNVADSTSNKFFLTGVQLETGDYNSTFEHRPYSYELARCQRYFYQILDGTRDGTGNPGMPFTWWSSSDCRALVTFPTTMRTKASSMTVVQANSGSNDWKFVGTGSSSPVALDCDAIEGNENFALLAFYSVSPTGTAGQSGWITADDAANKIGLSAEL